MPPTIKRSLSASPSPPPTTPTKKSKTKCTTSSTPSSTSSSPSGKSIIKGNNGTWTPEKREAMFTKVLIAGIKALKTDDLAREFEMSSVQVHHALQAGRKGNFRDKAIKAVKGKEE